MQSLFSALHAAKASTPYAADLAGRFPYITAGVVTNTNDPDNLRRVKATTPALGGETETDWLYRVLPSQELDPPVPLVGQTVMIAFLEGNVHTGCYFGTICNAVNPQQEKSTVTEDHYEQIAGDQYLTVHGLINTESKSTIDTKAATTITAKAIEINDEAIETATITAGLNVLVKAGANITFANTAGASLTLLASGAVILSDAFGHKWSFGGAGGSDWIWDANGANIRMINAGDFQINGKQVIVVGSTDSGGDTNVNRGY